MSRQPVLVYDGECRFCCSWINYWSQLSAGQVHYRPYQQAAGDYPQLDTQQFQQHIQYFDEQGRRYQGAAAAFQVQRKIAGQGYWWWLYSHLPGFAPLSERIYNLVAAHRGPAFAAQKFFWGKELYPDRYQRVSWLFLRLLALLYFAAFFSFYRQALALIGSNGLLPLPEFLAQARDLGFWQLPTLFWWQTSDLAIEGLCLAGLLASLLLLLNRLVLPCLVFLYLAYLSLLHGGQVFMQYQWDLLLLETGFLAIFLGRGHKPVIWLFRCLLFRFVFLAGAVKLLSGDPSWANLSALQFHFQTQPLPSPLAWYAHQLPETLLQVATALALVIELVLPWLFFLPRRPRQWAAWGLILLQLAILLTGNYNFFNLLTLVLCLFLFDDHSLRWLPIPLAAAERQPPTGRWRLAAITTVSLLLFSLNGVWLWLGLQRPTTPAAIYAVARVTEPWHWVNAYGLFANMTTERLEIVIEGSLDGQQWQAYELPFKPGAVDRAPGWNIPHQPRLDWQLWFAAQDSVRHPPWLRPLMLNLLFNAQPVTGLMAHNPFADTAPRYLRARLFRYRFTDWSERSKSGNWWQRQLVSDYYGPLYVEIGVSELSPGLERAE
ncbi:MAG: DUF393 domain-containing protein [Gammaproteobacteria bacterium]|nr:DUF393 domain-containing protein [Gammaproteobacteria bacterium]